MWNRLFGPVSPRVHLSRARQTQIGSCFSHIWVLDPSLNGEGVQMRTRISTQMRTRSQMRTRTRQMRTRSGCGGRNVLYCVRGSAPGARTHSRGHSKNSTPTAVVGPSTFKNVTPIAFWAPGPPKMQPLLQFWAPRPPKMRPLLQFGPLHLQTCNPYNRFGPLALQKCDPYCSFGALHLQTCDPYCGFGPLDLQKCNPYCILVASTSKNITSIAFLAPRPPKM